MLCWESYLATLESSFLTGSQALDFTCWWHECLLSKQPPSHFLSLWVLPPQTPVALPHLPQPQLLSLNIIQRCFKPFPFFPSHVPLWLRWEKKSACNEGDPGDPGSIPELGRSPGEGNGNPLQYSGLENSMNRGAWGATVHGVTKSETGLSDYTFFQTIFKSQNHFPSEEIHFYFILQSSLVSLILTSLF